ncbi:MAG: Gfo/Idh/MocA family oxidoreductase [Methylobacteriaceae bacterium]|nr:Gfo/Idh/MocA family oxidoreductase [Methylobacteriaceae bacterium]
MTTKELRYGLIGAGMMGREHIRNLGLIPGSRVTAISDPTPEQAALSAAEVEAHLGHTPRRFSDHRDLLASGLVDCVVIASPNDTHVGVLRDIFATAPELGVLVEKPVATSEADCAALEGLTRTHRAPIWVAMEYRYMPPVAELRRAVAAGEIGAMTMFAIREHRFPFLEKVGDWNRFNARTGGTLVEKCCHFFDLMRLVTGSEAVRVYASGAASVNHLDERYDGRRPDIIDNAFVVVDFANGMRASLDLCMFAEGAWFQEEIAATGDRARIEALIPGPARFWPGGQERESEIVFSPRDPKGPVRRAVAVDHAVLRAGDHHGSTYFQHLGFRAAMLEGGPVDVTLADGLAAVRIGLAAETSVRTGEAVRLAGASG